MHRTVVQQKAINEKNTKAKKAVNTTVKRREALQIKEKAKEECPAMSFFDQQTKKPAVVREK